MCRTRGRYFSTNTTGLPNAASDSLRACRRYGTRSFLSSTTRMPRPPPPCAALKIVVPCCAKNASAMAIACPSSSGSSVPGTVGMPRRWASLRASTLSPSPLMTSAFGPMKAMPAARTAAANAWFSDRKP